MPVLADFSLDQILGGMGMLIAAYLCGSVPFGYIAGRMKGVDLRKCGSGNIGATNVIRTLGKGIGIPVFILDFLKGFLPVFLASRYLLSGVSPDGASVFLVLMSLCAVLGHTYTCWLKFKGGKGVATGAGVVVALNPFAGGVIILVWIVLFCSTRYVSLASILAAAAFPLAALYDYHYFSPIPAPEGSTPILVFSFVIAVLVILKHKDNIKRLLDGTEHRAFSKKNNTEQQ